MPTFTEVPPGIFTFEEINSAVDMELTNEVKHYVKKVAAGVAQELDAMGDDRRGGDGTTDTALDPSDFLDMFLPQEVFAEMHRWTNCALLAANQRKLHGVGELRQYLGTFWAVSAYKLTHAEIDSLEVRVQSAALLHAANSVVTPTPSFAAIFLVRRCGLGQTHQVRVVPTTAS